MRPKEYYAQNIIQEDQRSVFTLLPSEFDKYYHKYIKEPIEKIVLNDGKVTCKSQIEFDSGVDEPNEIWRSIQRAKIIIADITGFKPDVMLGLGVALMKKECVFLMAEKSLDGQKYPPININSLKVEFYEPDKLDEFSDRLVNQVERWITPDQPKIKNPNARKLMNDVLGLRREKRYDVALLLFESMDGSEPGNWYINKEWGITFKENNDYENAVKKLQKALEFARANSHKSEIYTELGVTYRENNMVNEALVAFERAENLDSENAELYDKWAFLYHNMGKHQDAMNKMMMAVKLDKNNEVYKWRFEFYGKKFTDKNFTMGLGKFLTQKRDKLRKMNYRMSSPAASRSHSDRALKYKNKRKEVDFKKDAFNLQKIADEVVKQLSKGQVLFNPPKEMQVGIKERIEARISPNLKEDLTRGLKGRGVPQIERIDISAVMKAELSGFDFDIVPLSEIEQVISSAFTQWEWDVIPKKAGQKTLCLRISVIIILDQYGSKPKSLSVKEREIDVKVNLAYSMKENWKWFAEKLIP